MDALAIALVLCTVLYLVDKNGVWGRFWKFLMWSTVLSLIMCAVAAGYYEYQVHAAARTLVVNPSDVSSAK